jgi:arylsulfatase A-like enzyme
MDLYHTLLTVRGHRPPASADGRDISELLRCPTAALSREALFFHYPHYYATTTPVSAVRLGDWKLLEYFEEPRVELYNLERDLGETRNLAADYPEKAETLLQRLRAWRQSVDAALPQPNLDYHPRR